MGKYIALDDSNLDWEQEEVVEFDKLWSEGLDIRDISKRFRRTNVEVAVLVMDRHKKGRIKLREKGIFGGKCL